MTNRHFVCGIHETAEIGGVRRRSGSIDKIFTATVVAQLVTDGQLALTDSVGKLLPDYPNQEGLGATVTQLLDHRAGIADFFGPEFDAAPKSGFRSNADYIASSRTSRCSFLPERSTSTATAASSFVVMANLDPPAADQVAAAIERALHR